MPLLIAQFEIAFPGRLIVLVLLPVLVYLALRGRRENFPWQKAATSALRCLAFGLLCVAWSVPACRQQSGQKFVVVAVDESASVSAGMSEQVSTLHEQIDAARGTHDVRWIRFAESPGAISSVPERNRAEVSTDGQATNIAAAIHFAQANCPADRVPELLLISDGNETEGDIFASAATSDMPISTVALKSFVDPEVAVEAVIAPAVVRPHESLEVIVAIRSNQPGKVRVKLLRDGASIADSQLTVVRGETLWRVPAQLGEGPLTRFQATVASEADHFSENNAMSTVVARGEKALALVVAKEGAPVQTIRRSLQSGGFEIADQKPADVAATAAQLRKFQMVILNDLAAKDFSPRQLAALESFVRQGGGLIATGGEATFGAPAYELTALEKMLPVVATEQPEVQQKSLALVLVVDKSKSMEQENRLELAKEAAKKVADVLQESDQVGVLAFGDRSQWFSRLAPLTEKAEMLARIDRLQAEGLTNMYPAIQRAYFALSQADADSRHAILLTDGVPTPGDFERVAQQMADAGISVSTVSLGAGADQTILQDIARIAGGTHHHVDNPDDLPKILERETRTAASKVTGDEFPITTAQSLPGLDMRSAPAVKSFVATTYKPGAQLLLTAGEGDPWLAWHRHGRGKAMVLTSDAGAMTQWRESWPGDAPFWQRLASYVMNDDFNQDTAVAVRQHNGRVTVGLNAASRFGESPRYITDGIATLNVTQIDRTGDLNAKVLAMLQTAPGYYEAEFDAAAGEQLQLDIGVQVGGAVIVRHRRGIVVNYSDEFRLQGANEAKLRTIASLSGGKYSPAMEEIFAPDGRMVGVLFPLWQYFLIAALLAYVAEVVVRRLNAKQPVVVVDNRKKAA